MTFLLLLFGTAVAAGLFFIAADILKLPRLSAEKALLSAGKKASKPFKSGCSVSRLGNQAGQIYTHG